MAIRPLKAFDYDIGANPFLARHVLCLENRAETTHFDSFHFTFPSHRTAPWHVVQQHGLWNAHIYLTSFRPFNEAMNNGPLPTRLVFLSDLPAQAHGNKVRFLGCVTRYTLSTGVLELQHAYHPPPKIPTVALVDVNVVLEGLKREETQVGAWINVVGYVEEVLKEARGRKGQAQKKASLDEGIGQMVSAETRAVRVKVQAIMLWSAGGVKIGEYEKILGERLKLEKGSREGGARGINQ